MKSTKADILIHLLTLVLLYLVAAGALTWLLDVLHEGWSAAVPTMNYGTALLVLIFAGLVFAPFRLERGEK